MSYVPEPPVPHPGPPATGDPQPPNPLPPEPGDPRDRRPQPPNPARRRPIPGPETPEPRSI